MASMKRPRLQAVQALANSKLALTFINEQQFVLDLSDDLQAFPGLHPLQNAEAFAQAQLGDDGWTVEWPELDIQIGADTLFLDAQAQAATDENTRIFISWRARTGLPLAMAAKHWASAPAALRVTAMGVNRLRVPWPLRALAGMHCNIRPTNSSVLQKNPAATPFK